MIGETAMLQSENDDRIMYKLYTLVHVFGNNSIHNINSDSISNSNSNNIDDVYYMDNKYSNINS